MNQHFKPSSCKKNYPIYRAIRKYGVENFYYEILEDDIPLNQLDEKEIYYIEKYNSYKKGYNSTKGGDGRTFNKIEDMELIKKELSKGKTAIEISKDLGVCPETVYRALRREDIKLKDTINIEELKSLYKTHSHIELAKYFNVDQRTISRTLKKYGLSNKHKSLGDYFDKEGFFNDYNSGLSWIKLEKKYKISRHHISKLVNENKSQSTIES